MSAFPEMGQAIEWGWIQVGRDRSIGVMVNVDQAEVVRCLHADARRSLPNGMRYEIRSMAPENFGRTRGMAWYHHPDFAKAESWGLQDAGWQAAGGYYLVGQFVTPPACLARPQLHYEIGERINAKEVALVKGSDGQG